MSIYTKTGDNGTTSLASGARVEKTDARIEAYGTADELSAWIGLLCCVVEALPEAKKQLEWVQQRLFNLGAALSDAPGEWISEADVQLVEAWIDRWQEQVTPVRAFVLPAGSEAVSRCHVCRTVTRRLERLMCGLEKCEQGQLKWVNRLSDYLFVLARAIEEKEGGKPQIWDKEAKA